ncbi:hypothetical protein FGB62_187g04 [Gracilaria domingensis]|nr:hypothetical protein FGB62_187g04 [Gracilaria domingensis]
MYRRASTIYIDRGYVSDVVVNFPRDIGLHVVRTQKRGSQVSFPFGQSRIYKDNRRINEFGIMAAFWAAQPHPKGRRTFHLAFREASTAKERVVVLVTTRDDLTGDKWVSQRRTTQENPSISKNVRAKYKLRDDVVCSAMEMFGDRL